MGRTATVIPETLAAGDARVKRLRRLLRHRDARAEAQAFVVEGPNGVNVALDAGAELEAVFAAPAAWTVCPDLLARTAGAGVPVHRLAEGVLERVAETVTPQPVLAVARRPILAVESLAGATLVLVACDVRDPGNAGTLIRSAEAAGAGGVVFCRGSVDVTNPKTVRATAGALFHVPVVEGGDPQEVLAVLGDLGLVRIGALPRSGSAPADVDLCRPVALVLGNESWGFAPGVADCLDETVTIPMPGRAESLNLAMSASILLYEATRQRRPA